VEHGDKDVTRQPGEYSGYRLAEVERFHRATGENELRGGPAEQYENLRMTEFLKHALIHRAGPISELPETGESERLGRELKTRTRLGETSLSAYVEDPQSGVDGLLILQEGRIVYEAYPRMRSFDKHNYRSVSKPFASLVIALLSERGQIDVRQPLEVYLPELAGSGWEGVAVQDVLDMASGIACLEATDGAWSDPAHPNYQWHHSFETDVYAFMPTLGRDKAPGTAYDYSSINTFVLSWLAERLTGTPFSELLTQEIWLKIGAESDAVIATPSFGIAQSYWGMSSTLRDLGRFGLLYTPSWGRVAAEPIVSPTHLAAIQRGGRPEVFLAGDGGKFYQAYGDDRPRHNGWQWDAVWEDGDFYKGGFGGQGLYVSPARDLVIAFFGTPDEEMRGNELNAVSRQLALQPSLTV
jgi:CubicO group peptidase (beta-lactamase class C family)